MIKVWVDGLCEPYNPNGIGCYGFVIILETGVKVTGYDFIGKGQGMTNNVAEYTAFIKALEKCSELGLTTGKRIHIYSDSKLLVNQLNGNWRINSERLWPLWQQADALRSNKDVLISWIPREQNTEADRLSRIAYERYTKYGTVLNYKFKIEDYYIKE